MNVVGGCGSANWIVPGADPCAGGGGGVVSIVGTSPIVVNNPSPNYFQISYQEPAIDYTFPLFTIPNGTLNTGGGSAVNYGNLSIPAFIDPNKNPTLTLTIKISGLFTPDQYMSNDLSIGLFNLSNTIALGYFFSGTIQPPVPYDFGTAIPDAKNYTATQTFFTQDLIDAPLFATIFISYTEFLSPLIHWTNYTIEVSTTYLP